MRAIAFLALFAAPFFASALCFEQMTLEEKVGQLFMTYFEGGSLNADAKRLLHEAKVGGVVYYTFSNGLTSPEQVRKLSQELQEETRIPLLIAVDQEGGPVTRLREGFTNFPSSGAIGRSGCYELAYWAGFCMAKEMAAVGVNLNFAPVVDVNCNPDNPIIGERSFGDDPYLVTEFGRKSAQGFLDGGVLPCLKHFPGHGAVDVDSHTGLPIVEKSREEIEAVELYPFRELIQDAPAVMTAHILYPALDKKRCATLSSKIVRGLLRKTLGFEGVIITDSLTMEGVLQGERTLEEAALQAFEAGNDILLIGGRQLNEEGARLPGHLHVDQVVRVCQGFVHAVRSGRIPEERLDASVKRILSLKRD